VRILGGTCYSAGAFLAIRSLLREAGADVDSVMPSTPLAVYTRHHLDAFLGPISRLAPNAIPAVQISTPWYDLWTASFVLGLAAVCVGAFSSELVTAAGAVLALVSWAGAWIAAVWRRPSRVEFGSCETFRDLAKLVADGALPENGHG
jgi:hypothetical protein